MRYLGIKIHGGYTSEARPVAIHLGHRQGRYDACVICHDWPGDRETASLYEADSGAQVIRLDAGWRPNPDGRRGASQKALSLIRFRAAFPRILSAARSFQPDLVHSSQQLWDCGAATYVSQRLRIPHVIQLNYPIGPWLKVGFTGNPRMLEMATRMLGLDSPLDRLLACDHVVALSDFIRGDALRYGVRPDRVTTVYDSMRPLPEPESGTREAARAELGIAADAQVVGIVGRHDPDKGQVDTIRAFAIASEAHPGAWLVVVGDGPLRPDLERAAAETGVGDRTVFTGLRSDVPRLLATMDIFMHPSRREAFGLATAEASAAGVPVIAYAEGGACEILVDGETGLLAPPGDINALAACLGSLLADPARARAMGAAGRRRIEERFRPEDSGLKFAEVLETVVSRVQIEGQGRSLVPRDDGTSDVK